MTVLEIDKLFNEVLEEFTLDFYKREYFPHFYDITSELKRLKKEEINLRERLEKEHANFTNKNRYGVK